MEIRWKIGDFAQVAVLKGYHRVDALLNPVVKSLSRPYESQKWK